MLLKKLIIFFLICFAIMDIVVILHPSIKSFLEKRNKKKRQKAFAKKMKELEIK